MIEKKKLKIALVHDFLTKIGGAEKVLLVLHEMFPDAPIYTTIYDNSGTKGFFNDCKIVTSSLNKYPSFIKNHTKIFLPFYPKAVEEFDFREYDIVISSSNSFAHGILTSPKTFHLCYCHSPMRYAWDYTNEYLAENKIGFGLKGLHIRKILHDIRIWDKVSSHRVDKWIANSANVKNRINKYYGADSSVLFPPVDVNGIEMDDNIPDDYFVIVSRLEPYKKIELAIEAFNKLKKTLIIIGEGSHKRYLKSIAKSNIEFLGWQSDKSVKNYLKNARALIFPGEDDAGITPIESMASGRPVIAYNKGGAKECIIEGKTGLFFNDLTAESLINAVEKLDENYTQFTPVACRQRAKLFSKENFCRKFEDILDLEYQKYINTTSVA